MESASDTMNLINNAHLDQRSSLIAVLFHQLVGLNKDTLFRGREGVVPAHTPTRVVLLS